MGICGSSGPAYDPDVVDVNHFQEEREVGRGAFGMVFAVTWRLPKDKDGKDVWFAMKKMEKKQLLAKKAIKCTAEEV